MRCFKVIKGDFNRHHVTDCEKEMGYINAGYKQPSCQVACADGNSHIASDTQSQMAKVLAQCVMNAPELDASAAAPKKKSNHNVDADSMQRFKNRLARRHSVSGKSERQPGSTPARETKKQRANVISPPIVPPPTAVPPPQTNRPKSMPCSVDVFCI